jgi:hypothetical protein
MNKNTAQFAEISSQLQCTFTSIYIVAAILEIAFHQSLRKGDHYDLEWVFVSDNSVHRKHFDGRGKN